MRFSHRLYYSLKPMLPWQARMAVRRLVARKERAANRSVWPIKESAAKKPANWSGWPDGKQFAVVLTHDVEGPDGLAKVRPLAELEMKLGFRSSFNFIPSGAYAVPPELRRWLTERGFEVGVHDLEHDGRLFQSQPGFARKSVQINRHLREWGSAGFRGGFMLRNLDWLHDLDIEYDASTFDTDPFELQSDGADTIFPFWIPRPHVNGQDINAKSRSGALPLSGADSLGARGYVEMPYTLPQDSTLFLVLGEATNGIWRKKTDWIAQHGGMVLVNVHPDYIDFAGDRDRDRLYSVQHYEDLLHHIQHDYAGKYWHAVPRQIARWYRDSLTKSAPEPALYTPVVRKLSDKYPQLRGKRAAVLLYSEYPADPRPRRAAEAMIEAGMEVDLLCVAGDDDDPKEEVVEGVRVTRTPIRRSRDSKVGYFGKYARFINSSFWFLLRKGMRRKYDIVHVHNMPDVLVFSTVLSKLGGAKVILDLHDPMPEVMMTIYGLEEHRFPVRVLKLFEKLSIGLADSVITVNEACRRIFSLRSCAIEKINVIMNSPDATVFRYQHSSPPFAAAPASKRFVIMYHGSIVERHGLDIAVEALKRFRAVAPQAELRIYGSATPFLKRVLESVEGTELKDAVLHLGPKNLEQIAQAIRECDVGVIPNRRSIFTELNTPTRIFEYLSQGKAVIAPRAAGILDYFGKDDLVYFELGDVDDLVAKLVFVYKQPADIAQIIQRGQAVYQTHLWSNEKFRFIDVVARTLGVANARAEELGPQTLASAKLSR